MSALWTAQDIAAATGGTSHGDFAATGVSFDSREVEAGHLFIALKGESTDGHKFIDGAMANGAAGALVSEHVEHPHILVPDTTMALDALGKASRARMLGKVAGVTGSAGKTGTKEALADALARSSRGTAHRSVKSYNNHTGVPLSLARMPADSAFAVLEMGMNHSGELSALTQLVRPHVAIVTTIASAHREFFNTEEDIADAKAEIFEGLEPGGTAIIPFDSPYRDRLIKAAQPYASNITTFGLGEGADVHAMHIAPGARGQTVTAKLPGSELTFTLSQPGNHWVTNAMAVLAAVQAMGGDLTAAGLAMADMAGLAGRGARHIIAKGSGSLLIIDESYNANPASMAATLDVLGKTPAERRIAVLGEMRELGEQSEVLHSAIASHLLDAKVDLAILVGEAIAPLAKSLEGKMVCVHVADTSSAKEQLFAVAQAGDAILIKGSNAVGLSRLVNALINGIG